VKKILMFMLIQSSFVLAQEVFEACNPPVESLQAGTVADEIISQRMKEIFDKDQSMRMEEPIDWEVVSKADQEHRVEVMEFVKNGNLATDLDFYYAAFVFQHGNCPEHYKLANDLADQSVKLGYDEAKWIYAASLDRYLRSMGKPQKFGTQYNSTDGCTYTLDPVDPTTTDEERAEYDVPTLAKAEEQAKMLSEMYGDCDAASE
jgi:hypothetical protein